MDITFVTLDAMDVELLPSREALARVNFFPFQLGNNFNFAPAFAFSFLGGPATANSVATQLNIQSVA